jgi:TonB family protein
MNRSALIIPGMVLFFALAPSLLAQSQPGTTSSIGADSARGAAMTYIEAPTPALDRADLHYPDEARNAGMEGKVIVTFVLDTAGRATNLAAIFSSNPIFTNPALEAVRKTRFTPAYDKTGRPVRVRMSIPITFTLSEE